MEISTVSIDGPLILAPRRFADSRGFFTELYNRQALSAVGIDADFCQDNLSFSEHSGTIRGLHFQRPPYAQGKFVTVLEGAALDVVVDLRFGSASYGKHVAIELTKHLGNQLWIPAGFAHGFCTTEPSTVVMYKVTAPYSPAHDSGILWSDPALGIDWPVTSDAAILSEKDQKLPRLSDHPEIFRI